MFSKKNQSEQSQSKVKNIITINSYADKYYQLKNDTFAPLKKLTYNTSNYTTAYLANKDIISAKVSISRSIPNEDIADIIDIKAYEELGLDQASEYIISSKEVESSGEEREFHIFVAEPHMLNDLYAPIKNQTKYVDLIVPAPLLYQTLYQREILSDSGTHCFMYFTRKDAFVTLYKDGQYLYSKSIEFSLEQIYDKYCEMVGEKVDENEFFTTLETEGLKTSNNTYQQNFMKIFSEVFITINDIIIYAKRAFQLENIDQMYIGSVNGPIIGLDEYIQNYIGLQSSDLNFSAHVNTNEWYIDQLQYMMLLASLSYMEDESSFVNLTIFPRPPSFANRASGQFIISMFLAISAGLAYPLMYLVSSYANDAKIFVLQSEDERLSESAAKYKNILGIKRAEIKKLDEKKIALETRYSNKAKTLTSIHDKKVNYKLKSALFHRIAEEVIDFKVNVNMLSSEEDTLYISLVSSDDRKITELIKYVSDKHFNEIRSIDIDVIKKDVESGYVTGLLKVELR